MGSNHSKVGGNVFQLPTFKVLVVGDCGSGKTTIIRRYTQNQFVETNDRSENKPAELTAHSIQLPGYGEEVGVVFWEIPAHLYNLIKEEQYNRADAVIVVAKCLTEEDANVMSPWKQDIPKDLSGNDIPSILVINRFRHAQSGALLPATPVGRGNNVERSESIIRHDVWPQSGDESVHYALDGLLWRLANNEIKAHQTRTKAYPVSTLTSLSTPHTHSSTSSTPHSSILHTPSTSHRLAPHIPSTSHSPESHTLGTLNGSTPQSPGTSHSSAPQTPGTPHDSALQTPGTPHNSAPHTPGTPLDSAPQSPGTPHSSTTQTPGTPHSSTTQTPSTPHSSTTQTPSTPHGSTPQSPGTPHSSTPHTPSTPHGSTPYITQISTTSSLQIAGDKSITES